MSGVKGMNQEIIDQSPGLRVKKSDLRNEHVLKEIAQAVLDIRFLSNLDPSRPAQLVDRESLYRASERLHRACENLDRYVKGLEEDAN